MNRLNFSLLIILFSINSAIAQIVIMGQIVDDKEKPLEEANVYLRGTIMGAATNAEGQFRIEKVPAGEFVVTVSMIGYQLKEIPVSIRNIAVDLGTIQLESSALQSQPIVVTAAKHQQSLQDVSASIGNITEKEIRYRNAITIDDALKYESGLNLTGSQVNIRGSSGYSRGVGSRVLMLVNGIPYMTADTKEANFESLQINQIERIEIVKGAGSALYGSNAIGGVINIINKKIEPKSITNVRLYGGFYSDPYYPEWKWSDRTRYLSGIKFDYSDRTSIVGYRIGASHDRDDSYRLNDLMRRYHLSGMLEFNFSPFDQLNISAAFMTQERENFLYWKNLSNALIPPNDQLGDKVDSRRWHLSANYRHVRDQDTYYTMKTIWFQNRFSDNISDEESRKGNESLSDYLDGEFQYNFVLSNHQVTLGIAANVSRVSSNIFSDKKGYNGAFFAQDEIKWEDTWTVTPGLRVDYFNLDEVGSDYQINPKLGIVHKPWVDAAFRGSVGRGFRAPSIAEVFINTTASGIRVIPNLNLKPERSISGEVGYNQLFGQKIYIDLALFYNRYWDLIEGKFTEDGNFDIKFQNVTDARSIGFEINFNLNILDENLLYNFGYTYADVREIVKKEEKKVLGEYLSFRPRHLFYNQANYTWGDFNFGADYRFISAWDRIDEGLIDLIDDADERVPAHIVDLRISYLLLISGKPVTASFQINNLLQYHYLDLVGSIARTRNFMLTLSGTF
ncbi:MAG: TonB-dependent receptor [Calditrichia bacterium]|nr:TonB-dependent receptor [Calditrichia bacterium]